MEDDKVVCIKYKGKRVDFSFEENKDFEKSLKLAARESLINSKRKLQGRIERKYPVPKLRKHIDPDTNSACAGNNVKINGR